MYQKYKKRCLHKSLNFLIDLQITPNPILLDSKDTIVQALFDNKEFYAIKSVICGHDCSCCTTANKFVLLYSRIVQNALLNINEKIDVEVFDAFTSYLDLIQTENVEIENLTKIILEEPFFYEAFLLLMEKITNENLYFVEQQIEKINDEILRCIYFMLIYATKFYKCQNFDKYFAILLEYFEVNDVISIKIGKENTINTIGDNKLKTTKIPQIPNNQYILSLCGAVFYVKKDVENAKTLFMRNKEKTHHFMDLYSNLLYVKNDVQNHALLVLWMNKMYPYRPVTYTILGNYYSLLKDHTNAIKYFKKAIQLDNKCYTNYTLIAYEYMALDDNNEAINNFNMALKYNKNDYRALFGLAELYKDLKMYGLSMFLYKRSVEIQCDNGYCWLGFGFVLIKLEKYEDAIHALERAVSLDVEDALLKLGDCYKKMKMYDNAVEMYEKYVCKQKDNRILQFLRDYYKSKGNMEKSNHYANIE